MSDLVSYLFETNAIRFCEENKPFWYTSGKIGPYFINTHFVYGSEKEATELLTFIDECLSDKLSLPEKVFEKVLKQYQTNEIYKTVINTMKSYIEENIDVTSKENQETHSTTTPPSMVEHPQHYNQGGIECIDAANAMISGYTDAIDASLSWQVIKYLWRHPFKAKPIEDLKKCQWYLDRLIKYLENKN